MNQNSKYITLITLLIAALLWGIIYWVFIAH